MTQPIPENRWFLLNKLVGIYMISGAMLSIGRSLYRIEERSKALHLKYRIERLPTGKPVVIFLDVHNQGKLLTQKLMWVVTEGMNAGIHFVEWAKDTITPSIVPFSQEYLPESFWQWFDHIPPQTDVISDVLKLFTGDSDFSDWRKLHGQLIQEQRRVHVTESDTHHLESLKRGNGGTLWCGGTLLTGGAK